MRLRDSIALTLPSLFLRLVLGLTFVWAGTGKLIGTMQVSGDDAARLANLGITLDTIVPESAAQPQDQDIDQLDAPLPESTPDTSPETTPPANPPAATGEDLQNQAKDIIDKMKDAVKESTTTDTPPAQTPSQTPTQSPASDEPGVKELLGQSTAPAYTFMRVVQTQGDRTGSDFPEPVECQRLYGIALMISKAADPGLTADSQPITPIMPPKLAGKPWPKILAWSAAITELVAGGLLLIGFLTRISAMGTFFVMIVAIWMTQIGPAAMHSSDAILGFIPRHDDLFSPAAYSTLLWQLALASMSLAVVFLGSGAIGLDRLLFSSSPRDPYLHGDPKAPRKGAMNPATAQRSEFDRSPPKD